MTAVIVFLPCISAPSALALALAARGNSPACTARHGENADLRAGSAVYGGLLGKGGFSPDLSVLIYKMGVRRAPAHLVLPQQAFAVIFEVKLRPHAWARENAQSMSAVVAVSDQRTGGRLHVTASRNAPCGPSHPAQVLCQARLEGFYLLTSWLQRWLRQLLRTWREFESFLP